MTANMGRVTCACSRTSSRNSCSARGSRRAARSPGPMASPGWSPAGSRWTGTELVMPTFLSAPHIRHPPYRVRALRANPEIADLDRHRVLPAAGPHRARPGGDRGGRRDRPRLRRGGTPLHRRRSRHRLPAADRSPADADGEDLGPPALGRPARLREPACRPRWAAWRNDPRHRRPGLDRVAHRAGTARPGRIRRGHGAPVHRGAGAPCRRGGRSSSSRWTPRTRRRSSTSASGTRSPASCTSRRAATTCPTRSSISAPRALGLLNALEAATGVGRAAVLLRQHDRRVRGGRRDPVARGSAAAGAGAAPDPRAQEGRGAVRAADRRQRRVRDGEPADRQHLGARSARPTTRSSRFPAC